MDHSHGASRDYIACEVDLAPNSRWYVQPNTLPPVFQGRRDILFEIEESTSTKRGGKTTISKGVYVLFHDYSQTVITVNYNSQNPGDLTIEQRSEPPPSKMRQDQLEDAWNSFGKNIAADVATKVGQVVGDGTPHGLIQALLAPLPAALLPVGTRAYGALVYSNLANATVQQFDEIRAGDLITFKNAKFSGKHGAMHQKYNQEVGTREGHVAIVVEWDGKKKKIRCLEQGREREGKDRKKKVDEEGYRVEDLRSGEVKVWRVVGRNWVGWETS